MAFKINEQDLTIGLVPKQYLLDIYPSLSDQVKSPALWGWGWNDYGQLGDNTGGITNQKSSPVQTVAGGTNWKQVATGTKHTAAIKTDGTLWCWGHNAIGQLGTQNTVDKSSPVQTIAGGTNWKQVSCGYAITAAIKTDGTLWLCGYGTYGQLGNNASGFPGGSRSSPVQTITGGTNWKQVSCGLGTDSGHTAAIKTDGTLWTWGGNSRGQLGDGTRVNKSSPVQTIAGGTNWKSVSAGYNSTAAIKTDGTLWVCGYNNNGQLGDSTTAHKSSPVQTIAGGTNWKQVSMGGYGHMAAVKTDGTLWLCGYNAHGELGRGSADFVAHASPAQTIAGGTNWKSVSCGHRNHVAAIKTDGTLWGWGLNDHGKLGDNTITDKSSPVQTIAGGTNWKSAGSGVYHTIALKDDIN